MRFNRNFQLRRHLDFHFLKNNEIRKKGNRTISRPFFVPSRAFITESPQQQKANGKSLTINFSGAQNVQQGEIDLNELVPYSLK